MSDCICDVATQIQGNEGDEYARKHLQLIAVDNANWTSLYVCKKKISTGKKSTNIRKLKEGVPQYLQISAMEAGREFGVDGDDSITVSSE
ncbi:MAG: hypothetical protein Tsb002_13780 [Wenzhouxiangellaceae bacterium]